METRKLVSVVPQEPPSCPSSEEKEPPGTSTGQAGFRHIPVPSSPTSETQPFLFPVSTFGQPTPLFDTLPQASVHFPCNPQARAFRKKFFPETSADEWNDWRWQLRNRITDAEFLGRIVEFDPAEQEAFTRSEGQLPLGVTPYFAHLVWQTRPGHPIRRTVVPTAHELSRGKGEADDPLGEDTDSPVPGLVHRYPDRVLFLVTGFCSTYCRYCTRSRMVGHNGHGHHSFSQENWERALSYIEGTPSVRDVLLSGGDPLTLSDEKLDWLLSRLTRIPHVEMVRIGTKVPVVLPQRVTPALARVLKRRHPLWMSIHFSHPDEITPEVRQACTRLADAGIPLGSQTVLLSGVNDDVETMKRLVHGLLKVRVKPYYLYQCDPITGSAHFRTPVEKGLEIIRGLRGHTTGYAVPSYVIDAPGGGGKIPLLPDYVEGRDGNDLILSNFEGKTFRYPDPVRKAGREKGAPAPQ